MVQRLLRRMIDDRDVTDVLPYFGIGEEPLNGGTAGAPTWVAQGGVQDPTAAAIQAAATAPIVPVDLAASAPTSAANRLLRGNVIQNANLPAPSLTPPVPSAVVQPTGFNQTGPVASQPPAPGAPKFNSALLRGNFNPVPQSSVVQPVEMQPNNGAVVQPAAGAPVQVDALDQAAGSHDAEVLANRPFEMSGLRSTGDYRQAIADNQTAAMPEKHKFWDRFFRGVGRGLKNWSESGGQGGLGGLVGSVATGGIGSAASKGFDQELTRDSRNRKLLRGYAQASAMEDAEAARQLKEAQTKTIATDDELNRLRIQNDAEYKKELLASKQTDRESREKDTRMKTVAQMLAKIPNYDPQDERFAEITKTLKDLDLPLAPKDVKKQVKLIQDAETGAWTLALTDPLSGKQEVRPITDKEGKQLSTTSTAKVAADAAAGRQKSQQEYDAEQDRVKYERTLERDRILNEWKVQSEAFKAADRASARASNAAEKAAAEQNKQMARAKIIQLQSDLKTVAEATKAASKGGKK